MITIGKQSFSTSYLKSVTVDEAVATFSLVKREDVVKAWKMANPSEKPKKKQPTIENKD